MELCSDGKVRTWRPGKAGPPSPNSHPGQKRALFLSYPKPGLPLSTPGDQERREAPFALEEWLWMGLGPGCLDGARTRAGEVEVTLPREDEAIWRA